MGITGMAVASDGRTIYIIRGTTVQKSDDGGLNFSLLTLPSNFTQQPLLISVAPDNPNVLAVTEGTSGDHYVWISTDGGITWTNLGTPIPDGGVVITGVAVSPAAPNVALGRYYFVSVADMGQETIDNSNVMMTYSLSGWSEIGHVHSTPFPHHYLAVKTSPNFSGDRCICVVGATSQKCVDYQLISVNADRIIVEVKLTSPMPADTIISADIALSSDFLGLDESLQIAFIGIACRPAQNIEGVYRAMPGNAKRIFPSDGSMGIRSVAYCDNVKLLAGESGTAQVWHSANPLIANPVWNQADTPPPGEAEAIVGMHPDIATNQVCYAATSGEGSGFSVSSDNAHTFFIREQWPMYHHNCRRTGQSQYPGGILPHAQIKWSFHTVNAIYASPVVGSDGTIYVGSSDGKLYAIDHSGSLKWSYPTNQYLMASPAIGKNGVVYFGGDDRKFHALDCETGNERWSAQMSNDITTSPAIGQDGTVYFCAARQLWAYTPDGDFKWRYFIGNGPTSPAIDNGGIIYVAGQEGNLFAIKPDGFPNSPDWDQPYYFDGGLIHASPAIGNDGTIYVCVESTYGYLYAMWPVKAVKWRVPDPGRDVRYSTPVLARDGHYDVIYVTNILTPHTFNAFRSDGREIWSNPLALYRYAIPAIGQDGTIYVGRDDGMFYAYRPDYSMIWSVDLGSGEYTSPAIGNDGIIYVGSTDNNLYAIESIS